MNTEEEKKKYATPQIRKSVPFPNSKTENNLKTIVASPSFGELALMTGRYLLVQDEDSLGNIYDTAA
jgi:hypothetical protein